MTSLDLGEELNCSICLTVYRDPVTLSCGHSFCKGCIGKTWDSQARSGVYACPECRKMFRSRPNLKRNWKLCKVVNFYRFTQAKQQEEVAAVPCTYCLVFPSQAVKLCLQCEMLLCETHLSKHNERAAHVLAEPATSLESRRCPAHGELLGYYCAEENAYLCMSCCVVGPHMNHQIRLLSEVSEKKKAELRGTVQKLTEWSNGTKQSIDRLQKSSRAFSQEVTYVKDNIAAMFSDIRELLEIKELHTLKRIDAEEAKVTHQISTEIQELEKERAAFAEKILCLVELCAVQDPLALLQRCKPSDENGNRASGLEYGDLSDASSDSDCTFYDAKEHCSQQDVPADGQNWGEKEFMKGVDTKLLLVSLQTALNSCLEMLPGLKAKRGFHIQGTTDLTLDVGTAAVKTGLVVSQDLKTALHSETKRRVFIVAHQQFTECPQVLSAKTFSSGQHYWEVETSETGSWAVGVAFPSIARAGKASALGRNAKSWCLHWNMGCLSVLHNAIGHNVELELLPNNVGVYLDCDAGELSFYHVSDSVRHLHSFTATFTEPLHPAFYVDNGGWVKIKSLQC